MVVALAAWSWNFALLFIGYNSASNLQLKPGIELLNKQ
jgi:hypothetical protein